VRIAYFVTPHGFGHASRACAVMKAIQQIENGIHFDIFTTVPEWFFYDSLDRDIFTYHSMVVDIGLVQVSPLVINLSETIAQLNRFIPFTPGKTQDKISMLRDNHTQWIFSDISPLGIFLANQLQIPSILIENFTWDWIYQDYRDMERDFNKPINYFAQMFKLPDYHIQTQPLCNPIMKPAFISEPVSREPRHSRKQIRGKLGISEADQMVLITMGGIRTDFSFFMKKMPFRNMIFVVPGMEAITGLADNVITLPYHSEFFHPDLINASDIVIGKVGYSTLAEVYHAGKPFGYIPRSGFRESPILEKFIRQRIQSEIITEENFFQGKWYDVLNKLSVLNQNPEKKENGADQIARFFLEKLLTERKIIN
jgi:hypothetical protein